MSGLHRLADQARDALFLHRNAVEAVGQHGLDFSVGGVRVVFADAWGDRLGAVGGASAVVKVMQVQTPGPTLPRVRSVLSCLFYDIKNICALELILKGRWDARFFIPRRNSPG